MRSMSSYTSLGLMFLALGIAFLVIIDNALPAIIMIVGGVALLLTSWANERRSGPMRRG